MSQVGCGDEEMRNLFQNLPQDPPSGEVCPAPGELWASARGELAPEENRRLIDHTGRCPSCAEEWRLARVLARRAADGKSLAQRRPFWEVVPARRLVAAAALVVAVLGASGLYLWRQTAEREPVYRVEPPRAVESLVPEGEPLSRADPRLRWSGLDGAAYSLVVTSEQLEVLAQAEGLTESEYRLPGPVVAGLAPGTVLLWHVAAVLPDGARVSSKTFRVRIE